MLFTDLMTNRAFNSCRTIITHLSLSAPDNNIFDLLFYPTHFDRQFLKGENVIKSRSQSKRKVHRTSFTQKIAHSESKFANYSLRKKIKEPCPIWFQFDLSKHDNFSFEPIWHKTPKHWPLFDGTISKYPRSKVEDEELTIKK